LGAVKWWISAVIGCCFLVGFLGWVDGSSGLCGVVLIFGGCLRVVFGGLVGRCLEFGAWSLVRVVGCAWFGASSLLSA